MAHSHTKKPLASEPVIIIIGLGLIAASIWFFAPFIGVISVSALMAYLFFPVYRLLEQRMPAIIAAWSTFVITAIAVITPIAYLISVIIRQAGNAVDALAHLDVSAGSKLGDALAWMINTGQQLGFPVEQSGLSGASGIVEFLKVTLPNIISVGIQTVLHVAASAPVFMTSLIIYAFLFSAFLRYHKQIIQFMIHISPFDSHITTLYLRRSSIIVTASMKGQFMISFVTAVLSALLLLFLGFGEYFWLLVMVFTILGMIPLGSGVVVIPLLLVLMVAGDFWTGFWGMVIYLGVICNIDSVLRPRLIPKEAELVPVLAILATFCGLYYFGVLGVVYGPLIVIILSTTANILIESKRHTA